MQITFGKVTFKVCAENRDRVFAILRRGPSPLTSSVNTLPLEHCNRRQPSLSNHINLAYMLDLHSIFSKPRNMSIV